MLLLLSIHVLIALSLELAVEIHVSTLLPALVIHAVLFKIEVLLLSTPLLTDCIVSVISSILFSLAKAVFTFSAFAATQLLAT